MSALSNLFASVPQPVQWLLAGVGALYVSSKAISFIQFFLSVFVLPGTNLRKYGKAGTWAVITGASDGLGKEFALQLAKKGFNLVLVSRTQSKLEALAKDIEQKNIGKGLQIKTLAMDFSRDDEADYERLGKLATGLDIGILLNNVGQSHSMPVSFLETSRSELQNIITINCLGTLKTTQTIAPLMQQRKKPGLILTMSSFAGWMPTPYLATYSGSKAYLQHWSSALAAELKPDRIDVQVVQSYLVVSAMSKVRRASMLIPTAKDFVRSALAKVGTGGFQQIAYTYTPWWSHAVMLWAVENTIGSGSSWGIWYNLKMHVDIRRRALRKAAREAKNA